MILVCEIMFRQGAHVPFNAGLLATIRAAFPNDEIAFYGDAAYIEVLKKQVGHPLAGSISWNEIQTISRGSKYTERFFRELKFFQYLLGKLPQDSISRLLLTSALPSTVLAMKVARLFRAKKPTVQMVLHWVSGVIGKRYRHPIRRFQDMKTSLTLLGNNGIQYLVLEEPIRDGVVKSLPWLVGKIESLEHPISPNEGTNEILDLDEPIRFGFLGTALKNKGYPLFVDVANVITEKYGRRAEFHVIGRCPDESNGVGGTQAFTTQPAAAQLTRDDFIRGVALLHFVVLPYEAAQYTQTASGVLLDAIAWRKPVIARKIPIFEAMFDRYGDIGYLFSDAAELTKIVEGIVRSPDSSRYGRQVRNLGIAKTSRSPETLASAYRDICRRNGTPLPAAARDPE